MKPFHKSVPICEICGLSYEISSTDCADFRRGRIYLCSAWHRFTNDPSSTGNQHLSHLDEHETNSPTSKYFFCSLCGKWHTDVRKDHLQYRLHIQHFNRKNGFSFIVKGLKIAEIKLGSGGFVMTLIQNILNQGYTSVHQEKKDFVQKQHHRLP